MTWSIPLPPLQPVSRRARNCILANTELLKPSPFGMLLSGEQTVELVYAGQYVELTNVSASFYNDRQKVQVSLEKVIETDGIFDIGGDRTITFGLSAAEEIKAADPANV